MTPLPTKFRSDSFDFEQLARDGDVALFVKSKRYRKFTFKTFEVVIAQKREEDIVFGRLIAAHEAMPEPYYWGERGWSFQTLGEAYKKYGRLAARYGQDRR